MTITKCKRWREPDRNDQDCRACPKRAYRILSDNIIQYVFLCWEKYSFFIKGTHIHCTCKSGGISQLAEVTFEHFPMGLENTAYAAGRTPLTFRTSIVTMGKRWDTTSHIQVVTCTVHSQIRATSVLIQHLLTTEVKVVVEYSWHFLRRSTQGQCRRQYTSLMRFPVPVWYIIQTKEMHEGLTGLSIGRMTSNFLKALFQ